MSSLSKNILTFHSVLTPTPKLKLESAAALTIEWFNEMLVIFYLVDLLLLIRFH